MDRSKAILGVTWGFGEASVRLFLRSAEESGYDGSVVLFVARTAQDDIAAMRRSCEVIEVDAEHPRSVPRPFVWILQQFKSVRGLRRHYPRAFRLIGWLLRAAPGSDVARDMEFRLQGLQSLRYRHYLDYLESHPEIATVMISDLRDVVLQSDPLADVHGIEMYLEEPGTAFANSGFNATWIEDLYGRGVLDKMRTRLASCSGVTIGDRAAMLHYLQAMDDEISRHLGPLGPHDQGIHNFLLHSGAFPDAVLVPNGSGRVATLGMQADIALDEAGDVINVDDTVPAVVHQYDRHGWLARHVEARFGSLPAERG